MSFGFRTLYTLIFGVAVLAIALFTITSDILVERYSEGQKEQFIEQSFSAIAAGPLALARLHAGEMSQAQLQNWFSKVSASGYELISVSITGGQNNSFTYAKISSGHDLASDCLLEEKRNYTFQDLLNPMLVTIVINDCAIPSRLSYFRGNVQIVLGIAAFLLVVGFAILLAPIIQSIRRGSRLVSDLHVSKENMTSIPFLPVRNLVEKAMQASNEKTSLALLRSSRQVLHDIKAPIGAILAVAQHISSKSENDPAVKLLESASVRLEKISENLVSGFTNISAIDVEELHSIVVSIAQEQELRTGIKISTPPPKTDISKLKVECDRVLFGRVVSNLLTNAIESISQPNSLVSIAYENKQNFLVLNISDNGHGMSAETLERVKHGSFTSKDSGSGSGISSSISLMRLWNSALEIQSEPGSGTTVSLVFPIFVDLLT